MEPSQQVALFGEFLNRAVAEYSFSSGELMVSDIPLRQEIRRFETLMGAVSKNNYSFHSLTKQQFDLCLNEIMRDSSLIPRLMLIESFTISKWCFRGQPIPTLSRVSLHFGVKPRIGTSLQFDTIEQFYFIKQVLQDLRFCTLNEKHLREAKR